jgi:hypothetical protein
MNPTLKPRAKWLNDLLLSKGHARHKTVKRPSREAQKRDLRRELVNA